MNYKKSYLLKFGIFLLTAVLFFYGIIQARDFLYPLTFGFLLAYLLYPIVNFLEKKGVARILSILMSILFAFSIIGTALFLFYRQMSNLFEDFSSIKQSANNNIELLQHNLESFLGLKDNRIEQFLKEQVGVLLNKGSVNHFFSATTGTILRIVMLPIYVFLFLFYRTKFAYFILKVVKKNKVNVTLKILRDISSVAAKYMGGVSIVVLILCILNSVGLLIIGVKYAVLLGIISAFFNFIPYFGTLMGGAVPLLFVLLTTSDPLTYSLRVVLLFVIIQFTENNILTPNIVGGNVKINPFFIIVGLVLGGTVWGIPGMLVIVPILAILRIIFSNIDSLKPYAFLLGPRGTQRHSISIKNIKKFFSRNK